MYKKILTIAIIALFVLTFAGCESITDPGGNNSMPEGQGQLSMTIADKPVNDVKNVFVTIESVEVNKNDEWMTLYDFADTENGERQFDLMQLRFDEKLLGEEYLDAGDYSQIRLIVATDVDDQGQLKQGKTSPTKSYVVYKDDTPEDDSDNPTDPLTLPSASQTGLKISHDFTIQEGVVKILLLDVNVADMLHKTGSEHSANNKIMMRPTAIQVVDKIVSGDIQGRVVNESGEAITDADVVVAALNDNSDVVKWTVATTAEKTEDGETYPAGSFLLRGLVEGSYDLKAYVAQSEYSEDLDVPPADESLYPAVMVEDVAVNVGQKTILEDNIVLVNTGTIAGTVQADVNYDGTNEAITAADLEKETYTVTADLLDVNEDVIKTTEVAADGSFTFAEIEAGNYSIKAYIADDQGQPVENQYLIKETAVSVTAKQTSTADIVLDHRGAVTGRVTADTDDDDTTEPVPVADLDGDSISDIEVALLDTAGDPVLDENGNPLKTKVKTGTENPEDKGTFILKELENNKEYIISAYEVDSEGNKVTDTYQVYVGDQAPFTVPLNNKISLEEDIVLQKAQTQTETQQ